MTPFRNRLRTQRAWSVLIRAGQGGIIQERAFMPQDQKTEEEKSSVQSLMEMLEQGVKGEQPYARLIKNEVFLRITKAAGWREDDNGHFVSKTNIHIFINKIAKHPKTGLPLINPATDAR